MWPQIINTGLGIWLMAAPAVLGYGNPAQINDRIIGPLVATFACIAIWEIARGLRWLTFPLGIWMVLAPWILSYAEAAAIVNSVASGAAIALFSLMGGEVSGSFGGGWSSLWREEELPQA